MRTLFTILIGLTLVVGGLGTALASHNNVGMRFGVGGTDVDPTPTPEPDTRDGLRPVYHAGGSATTTPFLGDYARLSPADQSGLGYGEWIGYINGVVETFSDGFSQCIILTDFAGCNRADDPLYRVNPQSDDEGCDDVAERLDPGADPQNPNDDPCAGQDHPWTLDVWPGPRVQPQHFDVVGGDGAGFQYPGSYSFYLYLFGEGNGLAAGQGSFEYLDDDFIANCEDNTASGTCKLITRQDLQLRDEVVNGDAAPIVCIYAPQFSTAFGASEDVRCANISEFDQFFPESESSLYLANKPGWYLRTAFDDPFASTLPFSSTITMDGDQDHVANIFHFYVNPVPVDSSLVCAALPVETGATDGLDTGVTQLDDGTWKESSLPEHQWQLQGHDLDVYTSPTSDALGAGGDVLDQVFDQIPPLPPEVGSLLNATQQAIDEAQGEAEEIAEAADPLVDEANALVNRVFPTKADDTGPNHPDDNSYTLSRATPAKRCDPVSGLSKAENPENAYLNYLDVNIAGTTLRDYTATDEDGIPKEGDDQGYNPWHAQAYTFGGTIMVFEDGNGDGEFSACPPGADAPSPAQPDTCSAQIPWDMYNDDALKSDDTTWGDSMRAEDFADPNGLIFVLNVTGPVLLVDNDDPPSDGAGLDRFNARTQLVGGQGQNCIVGTSAGLLDGDGTPKASRVATLLGADSTSEEDVLEALCGPDDPSRDRVLLKDGFDDESIAGSFSAGISWVPLVPSPEQVPAPGDGLTVHSLITVLDSGDSVTGTNLDLGGFGSGDATVEAVWDDAISFKWTDVELFDSSP